MDENLEMRAFLIVPCVQQIRKIRVADCPNKPSTFGFLSPVSLWGIISVRKSTRSFCSHPCMKGNG